MRRVRYWLIGFVGAGLLAGGLIAAYFKFIDTAYSRAEFYADTRIDPEVIDPPGGIAGLALVEGPGRLTLAVSRGEPHGIVTTYHGWYEHLWIEIPQPLSGERIELDRPDVRSAFGAFNGRHHAEVGDGGIRGFVQIESVTEGQIVAVFDVTVDASYRSPYHLSMFHKETVFQGRSTFRLRPRPDDGFVGDLWPRPGTPKD